MKRTEVLKIIDAERNYQVNFEDKPDSNITSSLNMGGILSAIQHLLHEAQTEWYNETAPYRITSHILRKIAALCVKAGEDYGMATRA